MVTRPRLASAFCSRSGTVLVSRRDEQRWDQDEQRGEKHAWQYERGSTSHGGWAITQSEPDHRCWQCSRHMGHDALNRQTPLVGVSERTVSRGIQPVRIHLLAGPRTQKTFWVHSVQPVGIPAGRSHATPDLGLICSELVLTPDLAQS